MNQSRVTVVIPTYNRSNYLRESIASVLAQTYTGFDLLISDNASSDNTKEVVDSFQDSRIGYHRHPQNVGMLGNYRFVLTLPQTEFVAYLSDDDTYAPKLLETAVHALSEWESAAYFSCAAPYFGAIDKGELRPTGIADRETPLIYISPTEAVHFLGVDTPGPMFVCRRRALNQEIVWPQPDYLPGDLFLLTQLMVQGGFVYSNLPLYRFRAHDSNASLTIDKKKRQRFNLMVWHGIRFLCQYMLERGVCTLQDIERHGSESPHWERHVIPTVLGLASYHSTRELRQVAENIFDARQDVDVYSARFRVARRSGFWILPLGERLTQIYTGWKP